MKHFIDALKINPSKYSIKWEIVRVETKVDDMMSKSYRGLYVDIISVKTPEPIKYIEKAKMLSNFGIGAEIIDYLIIDNFVYLMIKPTYSWILYLINYNKKFKFKKSGMLPEPEEFTKSKMLSELKEFRVRIEGATRGLKWEGQDFDVGKITPETLIYDEGIKIIYGPHLLENFQMNDLAVMMRFCDTGKYRDLEKFYKNNFKNISWVEDRKYDILSFKGDENIFKNGEVEWFNKLSFGDINNKTDEADDYFIDSIIAAKFDLLWTYTHKRSYTIDILVQFHNSAFAFLTFVRDFYNSEASRSDNGNYSDNWTCTGNISYNFEDIIDILPDVKYAFYREGITEWSSEAKKIKENVDILISVDRN